MLVRQGAGMVLRPVADAVGRVRIVANGRTVGMESIVRTSWHWLALIGLFGGFLSGTLGVGSGILIIPALALGLGLAQKTAQGTCLAVMVPMALTGALRYSRNSETKMDLQVILILAACAVIGAVVGSSVAQWVPGLVLRRCFGAFVIVVGVKMLWG